MPVNRLRRHPRFRSSGWRGCPRRPHPRPSPRGEPVRHRRPDCGDSPQPRWLLWPEGHPPSLLIHTFHRHLCTLLAWPPLSRPSSCPRAIHPSDRVASCKLGLPADHPGQTCRQTKATPRQSGKPRVHLCSTLSFAAVYVHVPGALLVAPRATTGRSAALSKKRLIPIINKKGAVCGQYVPAFLTFSTPVNCSVDKPSIPPVKRQYWNAEMQVRHQGFSR